MQERQKLYVVRDGVPLLSAVECGACGYVDFPPQHYGCRMCGQYGDALVDTEIASDGTVVSGAEVHHFPNDKYEVPFTVAVIALDAGPVTRAAMKVSGPLQRGQSVVGVIVGEGDGAELNYVAKESVNA